MRYMRALAVAGGVLVISGCNALDVPNFNDPSIEDLTSNPTVNSVVSAAQNQMAIARGNTSGRVLYVGIWGREAYDLRPEEPRTTTDRLIGPVDPVNGGAFWGGEYTNIKDMQVLLDAVDAVEGMPDADREAIRGFAKTVAAESYWNIIMMHTSFGAALDPPADPGQELSPIVSEGEVYTRLLTLLDEADGHLAAAGSSFPFQVTAGYAGFDTPGSFRMVNRAFKARVLKYRGDWNGVMTALGGSFIDDGAPMDMGIYHDYSTNPGDASNPFFGVPSQFAHPRFRADAQQKPDATLDDRALTKTEVQDDVFSLLGIDVTEKFVQYDAQDTPLPWIKNEELILIRAEAKLGMGDRPGAIDDINIVRNTYGLADFADPGNDTQVLDELLYNKFMSLAFEGGYTYFDARQYGRLDDLPRTVSTHVVFPQLPFPQNECLARDGLGTGNGQPCGTIFGN